MALDRFLRLLLLALALLTARGQQCMAAPTDCPKLLSYTVVAEYPHDKGAFTQGFQYDKECDSVTKQCKDIFWESTGLYGESTIRKVLASTGEVLQQESLPAKWFAEGLTRLGNHLYQLTWKSGVIFKWEITEGSKLKLVGEVQGPLSDGWGMTTDGKQLVITDSSAVVYFVDPATMKVSKQLTVTDAGRPVKWLNELEVIDGELWANIWQTECIARVDMTTGQVTHWMLLHGLKHGLHQRHPQHHELDVLNGIAYDAERKRLFITGKKWPRIFEVVPRFSLKTGLDVDQVRKQCIV